MSRSKNITKEDNASGALPTTLTNLPGLKNIKVIVSYPMIVKENSSKPVKR